MKHCTACGGTKELDEFNKRTRNADGLNSTCRECTNEYNRKNYKSAPKTKDAIASRRAYRRQHYRDNEQAYKDRARKWREENPERRRELHLAHYAKDREKYLARAKASDYRRRAQIAAQETDLDPGEVQAMIRAAVDCSLCGVEYTRDDPISPSYPNLDHIVPLSCGGAHTRGNIRVICRDCNIKRPRDGRDVIGMAV